jgi:hypothetical protein
LGDEDGHEPEPAGVEYTSEEREVLSFLAASKRVDLRWLSEEEKEKIRRVLDGLHNGKKVSLLQISKEVGRSYFAIWGLCRSLEIPTRTVAEAQSNSAEARSKHRRRSFDGTEEDRAYTTGFKNGDLTAWQVSGTAVMVTSTTTHPAFASLFSDLFDRYGKVYQYPMLDGERGYKWRVAVRLDNSFRFLLSESEEALSRYAASRSLFARWLAGLFDADGHINVGRYDGFARVRLDIGSINERLLASLKKALETLGYFPSGLHRPYEAGFTTPQGITYRHDMWRLDVQRTEDAIGLLKELPNRHWEKVQKKRVAISMTKDNWDTTEAALLSLKREIRAGVAEFRERARIEYEIKKQKKTSRPSKGGSPQA